MKLPYKNFVAIFFIAVGLLLILKPDPSKSNVITISKENTSHTKGWKIYENDKFNFSFKYPDYLLSNFKLDFSVKTSQTLNEITEIKNDNDMLARQKETDEYNVVFQADATKYEGSIDEFINEYLQEAEGLEKIHIKFGNIKGYRISNFERKSDAYFEYNILKNDNFIYNFAIISDEAVLIRGNSPLLHEIISTAKFE